MIEGKQTVRGVFSKKNVSTAWFSFWFWVENLKKRSRLRVTSFCEKIENIFSHHQMELESWNYDQSIKNRKFYQVFRKNHPWQFVFILPLQCVTLENANVLIWKIKIFQLLFLINFKILELNTEDTIDTHRGPPPRDAIIKKWTVRLQHDVLIWKS